MGLLFYNGLTLKKGVEKWTANKAVWNTSKPQDIPIRLHTSGMCNLLECGWIVIFQLQEMPCGFTLTPYKPPKIFVL
jgi:hypothetical protein